MKVYGGVTRVCVEVFGGSIHTSQVNVSTYTLHQGVHHPQLTNIHHLQHYICDFGVTILVIQGDVVLYFILKCEYISMKYYILL